RLFCNLDNRVFDGQISDRSLADQLFDPAVIRFDRLCLELSERSPIVSPEMMERLTRFLVRRGAKVALDDFGVGVSSLQLLMRIEPHYVKIDRCFIEAVATSQRKQAIVAKLCELSHALGFFTVAEGVETEADFRMARDLGCDFAQGYHIARPTQRMNELATAYGRSVSLSGSPQMSPRVAELLCEIPQLPDDAPLAAAAEIFKRNPALALIPVVDREGVVQGAILEKDMRRYLLSEFGPSLLANKSAAPKLTELISRCPVADAHGAIEAIVNSYVAADSTLGMILAAEGRYAGYLTNNALLRLASERDVTVAREQNPLTQLPGNQAINRRIAQVLGSSLPTTLVLFDFDNFKAFNDVYGFAAGDRALTLFAGLLRSRQCHCEVFAGHIGGDDFFLSLHCGEEENESSVRALCDEFSASVARLYSPGDRERGGVVTLDRFGERRFFPLLRASAGIVHLPLARAHLSQEMVESQLAAAKDGAKKAAAGLLVRRLPESGAAAQRERIVQAVADNRWADVPTGAASTGNTKAH
ncbi:MAG TPA: bifunctional diguanylate cyclase/phosphodiesterase, partial [Novosphingobium sp.]